MLSFLEIKCKRVKYIEKRIFTNQRFLFMGMKPFSFENKHKRPPRRPSVMLQHSQRFTLSFHSWCTSIIIPACMPNKT